MNIILEMSKYPSDTIFSVGMKNGSSFVFIGTLEEFIGEVEELNQHYYNKLCRLKEKAERSGFITRTLKHGRSIKKFTPIESREVVDTYRNISGRVIIVEGDEKGNYWTLEQYRGEKKAPIKISDDEKIIGGFCNAIIVKAAEDYMKLLKEEMETGKQLEGEQLWEKKNIEAFFHGDWFVQLTKFDACELISRLKKEVEKNLSVDKTHKGIKKAHSVK